jgi:tRNA (guanine-N7-)-methyltransferase
MTKRNSPAPKPTKGSLEAFGKVLEHRLEGVREDLARWLPPETGPLVWEIGSGHGHFLNAFAAAHPDRRCVGVDIESSRIERSLRKRDRARLPNLHFIRSEARLFLQALPSGVRLGDVFILFPDPWPKARHHKHRLLQPAFLATLAEYVTAKARLHFRTDHAEYFAAARAAVAESPLWQLVDEPWPYEAPSVFQTRAPSYFSWIARRR